MRLKHLEINGFKSFAKKTSLEFGHPIVSIVGPNGSGKSNVVEALRFVLGEQSMKSMRGKGGADLIFKGSKSLPKGGKASVTIHFDNQDKVFKLFDDAGEAVPLGFDTLSLAREVYADGLNKYILNGSEVRLKDIHNLLASVNIGSSGHHIISQGEADRILNANAKDLREIIEDALGLKIYQYKIRESERKLERSTENMKEIALQRRENAPHLNFLKKQVEKFEKVKEMRSELAVLYKEYLKKESIFLENERKNLKAEKENLERQVREIGLTISGIEEVSGASENQSLNILREEESKLSSLMRLRGEIERKLGRVEGMIEMEGMRQNKKEELVAISPEDFAKMVSDLEGILDEAMSKDELQEVRQVLARVRELLDKFKRQENKTDNTVGVLAELENSKALLLDEVSKLEDEEKKAREKVHSLKEAVQSEVEASRDKEREKFSLKVRQQELVSLLDICSVKLEGVERSYQSLKEEEKEAVALSGEEVLNYGEFEVENLDRAFQEELKKKIERIKIKLEDASAFVGSDVIKEYEEVKNRDEFLAKEMQDLEVGIESLEKLIEDLKHKIDIAFKEGLKKINVEFQQFFALMFGGGQGALSVVSYNKARRGEEEAEEEKIILEHGLEINVSLPHKKVKELHMLSGGERSLTSIALLFAMSAVNPPPFLVLDETDAALDEANSRKYGDMLERLSAHSQLVVVTHNRETMSRAGILYGVTIGADGASKLLSVKFEEAQAIAK